MKSTMTILMLFLPTLAFASGNYCQPTSSGKDRFPKTGTCPSGYFSSGQCCEAYRADEPKAFPKIDGKACPSGTYASGSACKSYR